ncbi:MAG: phosphatase PAP2 family protein [Gemmatimonadales bacterium]
MLVPRTSRVAFVVLLLFAVLSIVVARHVTQGWDTRTVIAFSHLRHPGLTRIMQVLSDLGSGRCEIPLALGIGALAWRTGHGADGGRYLLIAISGEAVYAVSKEVMHRPRPSVVQHLSDAGWYSYPSGHSMMAWIVWGLGLVVLARILPSRRASHLLYLGAVVLPLLISVSRVYLGVHYPTDVLAGLLLAAGWILLWWAPSSRRATSSAPATR